MARNLVGARELKTRLGTYLRRVREGRTVVVTDRGLPVAELRPIGADRGIDAAVAKLRAIGTVTRLADKPIGPFREIRSRGRSVETAVVEDREERF